jgi:hypothetical protein
MLKKSLCFFSILATFVATGVFADEIKKIDEAPEVVEQPLALEEEVLIEETEEVLVQAQVENEEEEVEAKEILAGCPTGNCPFANDSEGDEEETPINQAELI